MRISLVLTGALLLFSACKKDVYLSRKDLEGNWTLVQAYRGEKTTVTLNGAFYAFQDTMLTTNIFGESLVTPYRIENKDVVHFVPFEMRYGVTKNPDSTLLFSTMIDGIPFRFVLKKG